MDSLDAAVLIEQISKAIEHLPEPRKYPDGELGQTLTDARCSLMSVITGLASKA